MTGRLGTVDRIINEKGIYVCSCAFHIIYPSSLVFACIYRRLPVWTPSEARIMDNIVVITPAVAVPLITALIATYSFDKAL